MSVWFGPAGLPDDFPGKSSVQAPAWLASLGLDAFEYQCGKGVNVGEETARWGRPRGSTESGCPSTPLISSI